MTLLCETLSWYARHSPGGVVRFGRSLPRSGRLMLVFAGAHARARIEKSGRPARDARRLAAELVEAAVGARVP